MIPKGKYTQRDTHRERHTDILSHTNAHTHFPLFVLHYIFFQPKELLRVCFYVAFGVYSSYNFNTNTYFDLVPGFVAFEARKDH